MASTKRVHVQIDLNLTGRGPSPKAVVRLLRLLYDAVQGQQATLASVLASVHQEGLTMSTKLDSLTAAVARANSVADSAVTLIKGLAQQIRDAGTDDEKLKALADSLEENSTELAEAVRSGSETEDDSDDDAPVVIGGQETEEPDTKPVDENEHGTPVPESNPTYPGTIDPDGPDSPVVLTGPNTDEPGEGAEDPDRDTTGPSADTVAERERTPEDRAASAARAKGAAAKL